MRFGQIPEWKLDLSDSDEGIPMVKAVIHGRTKWVELSDPELDGKTIRRDSDGSLIAEE